MKGFINLLFLNIITSDNDFYDCFHFIKASLSITKLGGLDFREESLVLNKSSCFIDELVE